jgi:hypothetical protein
MDCRWLVRFSILKPYHGKRSITTDADVTKNAQIEWEIPPEADLGNQKKHIPAVGYLKVLVKG